MRTRSRLRARIHDARPVVRRPVRVAQSEESEGGSGRPNRARAVERATVPPIDPEHPPVDVELPLLAQSLLEAQRTLVGTGSVANDPLQTWAAQDFRTAKALFVPSVKRDIVPSVAWT